MVRQDKIVIAGTGGAINPVVLKQVRGSIINVKDYRFLIIALISIAVHGVLAYYLISREVQEEEVIVLEQIPERFARLIIEKPLVKEPPKAVSQTEGKAQTSASEQEKEVDTQSPAQKSAADRRAAKKAVAARAARVEEKVRTVGVLGMLTGVGKTARGPSVVDVLDTGKDKKERMQDLDDALKNITGLKKADNQKILDRKLVKSKDVAVSHKESIDDLIAGIGSAKSDVLAKKGDFIIQRPESIEGAASSSAKRDNSAINNIVNSHKISIRMSYEKYLKRNPSLAGKITVRFTISANGRVVNIQLLENTTSSDELGSDIMRKVRMWRFEEIPQGDVTVTYPFVFAPS